MHSNLDPPRRDVGLRLEPLPPRFAWYCVESDIYLGASLTEEGRALAIRRAGHRVVAGGELPPEPVTPPGRDLPPVTAEAIRAAGMVEVSSTVIRTPTGPATVRRLVNRAFPDLQRIERITEGATVARIAVGDDFVEHNPARIVAALEALGAKRQPPMKDPACPSASAA